MASAGSLIFELAADVSRLRTDMGKAQAEIKSSLDSIAKSSAATAVMTGAQFAMDFAKGFADKIKAAVDQADAIGKLAQRIGTSTEAISGLNYAAGFAGVSLDDLTTGFKGLNKAMLDSKDTTSDAAAAFKALGLNAAQLRQMDPSEAFNKIATAMSGFKDGAEKAAVANALFGKQGQALIPLLNQGAEGIKQATDEAERMGLIVSGETAKAMGDLNDDLARMQKQSEGAAAILARELQPAFHEVIEAMKDAQKDGTIWNDVLQGVAITAKAVIGTLVGLAGTVVALGKVVHGFGEALNQPFSVEGFKKSGEIMSNAFKSAQDTIKSTEDSMTKIIHVQTQAEKVQNASAAALGRLAGATDQANKADLKYSDTKDALSKKQAKQNKELDEYTRMLEDLQTKIATLQANGNPLAELQFDPKFLKLSKDHQQSIEDLTRKYLNLKEAQDLAKQEQADIDKSQIDAANNLAAYNKQLETFTQSNLDTLDPLRVEAREMAMLNDALDRMIITQDQYNKLVAQSEKKTADAFASMSKEAQKLPPDIKVLKDAIEGFGKQSSDAFVNFIFNTKDASTSFSEMVSSILKDLAKMIIYQNIMQPLFSTVSTGVTGGGWDWSKLLQGGRMGGGPVSAGRMYEINEIPGRREYFIPNVPGKVVTDAGAANGGTNVTVNVHMMRDDRATQDTTASDRQTAELGNRIATVVRTVISQEKRTGGLLASTR
ncbi:phage tail tape measure C-terminal domain-containing protein [Caballeronia sp. LP003]|uniref:hypothetical protein n=1 Tax=Caballeronia sp. LP003 TaxID=3038551 RepID=UPI0028664980|nr:hypothetical protein [Caballeronia sp. LP003]MDR5790277.1 phage tail tape measure C-terminal domain-containing protein [Caballeronia sp. LP003]